MIALPGLPFVFALFIETERTTALKMIGLSYLAAAALSAPLLVLAAALFEALFEPPSTIENNPFNFTLWSPLGVRLAVLLAPCACLSAWTFWCAAVRKSRRRPGEAPVTD